MVTRSMARIISSLNLRSTEDGTVSAEVFLVISNNPAVKHIKPVQLCIVEGDGLAVLYKAFNMSASGHPLLSHPLAGNIKPEDNYYRSIVFSAERKDRVDFNHLRLLDRCLSRMEDRQDQKIISGRLALYARDYQIMDLKLLNNALQALAENRGRIV